MYSNTDISNFNLTNYITKIEDGIRYEYPFERIKHLMKEDKEAREEEAKDKAKEKSKGLETINEEEETKVEEVTDEQAEQIQKEQEEKDSKRV